jgi:hypothetical protein
MSKKATFGHMIVIIRIISLIRKTCGYRPCHDVSNCVSQTMSFAVNGNKPISRSAGDTAAPPISSAEWASDLHRRHQVGQTAGGNELEVVGT